MSLAALSHPPSTTPPLQGVLMNPHLALALALVKLATVAYDVYKTYNK